MSWLLAFIGFAALIVLHELGHFAAAKAVGMRVERFALFFPPLIARKTVGETEYAIGALPLGGYVKISGMSPAEDLPDDVRTRAYYAQPVWKRVVVIAAGPLVNLVLALVLLFVFFAFIGAQTPTTRIGLVERGLPAAGALRPGDRVVSVDGRPVGATPQITEAIAAHGCPERPPRAGCRAADPATVVVERDGRQVALELRPVYDAAVGRMRLGFGFESVREPLPAGPAVTTAIDRFWYITGQTLALPARLFDAEDRRQITGVVGTYETTRQTILNDLASVVGLLAIISLSLGVINLFPFLPLDGGHIFWAAVELVRRRPVPFHVMERAGVVGFVLVMGLFLLGLSNDIGRLQGEGFGAIR